MQKDSYSKTNYIKEFIEPSNHIVLNPELELNQRIFINYIKKQKKNFALDFNDLIYFALYIFSNYPEILYKWQNRLNYIMIDEAQDNSDIQWYLIDLISQKHKNLLVVGDPDQSIYEWRSAKPESLVDFDKAFSPCNTIIMDENYRSTPDVLHVANCIIKNNKKRIDKDMFTRKVSGTKVTHFHGKTEQEEGQYVAQTILKKKEVGRSLKDFAILYRANNVSRSVEQALIKNEIPYVIYGGIRFFERKEIKDAISYLHMVNRDDDMSFLRIINRPSRKLGKVFISKLNEKSEEDNLSLYETLKRHINIKDFNKDGAKDFITFIEDCRNSKDELSISDLLQYILEESGLMNELRLDGEQERLDNIEELMASIKLYEKENTNEEIITLDSYLQDIALYTNLDYKEETEFVKLMTIHQAKGLEFDYVFVYGMSEGVMPNYRSLRAMKIRALEEERRLAYVAITRAKKELFLTESEGFNFENNQSKYPSRFIFEIKDEMLVLDGVLTEELKAEARINFKFFDDTVLFPPPMLNLNDKVSHPVFGLGKIIEINNESESYLIDFEQQENHTPINFRFGRRLSIVE